jgi:4-hydroxy-3-methylbut-2-enyl diphosphate reductase
VIVNDMNETIELARFITGERPAPDFYREFKGRYSEGFDAERDLQCIGVVNQTTMLASDTQAIADYLKQVMMQQYRLNEDTIGARFADTRDTLCYATNDNQTSVTAMLDTEADLAIVIGGYNSSNTSHLVELCENRLPTYFIRNEDKILSRQEILHYHFKNKEERVTHDFLPSKPVARILITSGASCPDALVEAVISKLASLYALEERVDEMVKAFQ